MNAVVFARREIEKVRHCIPIHPGKRQIRGSQFERNFSPKARICTIGVHCSGGGGRKTRTAQPVGMAIIRDPTGIIHCDGTTAERHKSSREGLTIHYGELAAGRRIRNLREYSALILFYHSPESIVG